MPQVNFLYEFVEKKIGSVFARYGRFVAGHPWKVLIIAVAVNLALGIGMVRFQIDIDAEHVYLPQDSQSKKDQILIENTFPDLTGSNYHPLYDVHFDNRWARVIVRAKSGNLLTRTSLEAVKDFNTFLQTMTATADDGTIVTYNDICARAYGICAVDGSIFWNNEFLAAVDAGNVTFPVFVSSIVGNVYYNLNVDKSATTDANGFLTQMEYIHLNYELRKDASDDNVMKWMDAFVDRMEAYNSDKLDIAYGHHTSIDEELHKNVLGDIKWFAITILLSQRAMLGLAGISAAALAILASFGLCSAIGLEFVSIVGTVPFLIIGIGIDDMFLLLSALAGAEGKDTVEDKMAATLQTSCVSITISSLTDLIAFMSGVAVVFCYLNNITIVAAALSLNERRVAASRHFLTCRRVETKPRLEGKGKSRPYIICCSGSPPSNREEAESLLDKFPRWLFPKIVLKLPFKILIILLFLGYLAAGIYGCVYLKQGLEFTQLVQEDSYFFKYSDLLQTKFKRQYPISFLTTQTYTYTDPNTKALIDDVLSTAKANDYFDDSFESNWLTVYMASAYYDGTSETNFINGFRSFITDPKFVRYENDVVIDSSGTKITASRYFVLSRVLVDSQEEGKMMLKAREIAKNAEINCLAFSPYFDVFEQYVSVLGQTLQSVGIALAAVFIVTCLLMPHPVLIIFVTVAVTMIMVGVFGYMLYVDIALSAITMVQLIMCIGFSIDFTAHICHGYIVAPGVDKNLRVEQAIDEVGAPIFHGAVSSLCGVVILFAATSYIFKTFATIMCFVLLFGIAHALLLLPVVLTWVGPGHLKMKRELTPQNSHRNLGTSGHSVVSNGDAFMNNQASHNEALRSPKKSSVAPMNEDVMGFKEHSANYDLDCKADGECSWKKSKAS
ncbi:PTHD3-like protein [Mya arenaria]|uniref:PTHD3-like protein n=1 Tax=Mya arenaria TaxID=6604 RepID=A0ABY7G3T1_MYAAR|nr:PTHD3-like protein [Mya arenaria]